MNGVAFKLHETLKGKGFVDYSYAVLQQAVGLAKTDLTTELVKELRNCKGNVGGLYIQAQGLPGDFKKETVEKVVRRFTGNTDQLQPTMRSRRRSKASCSVSRIAFRPSFLLCFSIGSAPNRLEGSLRLRERPTQSSKFLPSPDCR